MVNGTKDYKFGQLDEQVENLTKSVDSLRESIDHMDKRLTRLERFYWGIGFIGAALVTAAPFGPSLLELL